MVCTRNYVSVHLTLLKFFVVMDAASSFCGTDSIRGNNAALSLQPSGSFWDWINAGVGSGARTSLSDVVLPDPFDARGSPFRDASGKQNEKHPDITTVLFTSGSSGNPKAVAVSCEAFVEDISGCKQEALAVTHGITVSYIPLSHSSDRYKVWQHVCFGGRVGFASFGAEQWEWREKGKDIGAGSSPVEELFAQVSALRPTSMSLPPNIWAGLRDMWEAEVARLRRGDDRVEEDTSEGSSVALETADQLCSEAEALEEKAFDMLRWKTFGSPSRVGLATAALQPRD